MKLIKLPRDVTNYAITILFAAYYFIFLRIVTVNIAWLSWFDELPLVDKFFQNRLRWADLITHYGEHGMLGYNVLYILNALIFKLSNYFDAYINLIVIFISSLIILYRLQHKAASFVGKPIQYLLLTPLMLIMFTWCQDFNGGMETQVRLGILFTVIIAFYCDKCLSVAEGHESQKSNLAKLLLALAIGILVFGTMYSFALFPGLIAVSVAAVIKRRETRPIAALISIYVGAIALSYLYIYHQGGTAAIGQQSIAARALALVENPLFIAKFLLSYLSTSTLTRYIWTDGFVRKDSWMLINGILVGSIYCSSAYIYFKKQKLINSWMPLLLMTYSFMVGVLVLLGRGAEFGWDGGTKYWYSVHPRIGLAGIMWINIALLYGSSGSQSGFGLTYPKLWRLVAFTTIGYCTVTQICSNAVEFLRARNIRNYSEHMRQYAFYGNNMPIDRNGLTPFMMPLDKTLYALDVMNKYHLNMFHDFEQDSKNYRKLLYHGAVVGGVFDAGWYQQENGHSWIGDKASLNFISGPAGRVVFEGYLPDFLAPNSIKFYVNGSLARTAEIGAGSFSLTLDVKPETRIFCQLVMGRTIVPKEIGLNNDVRRLGVMINSVTQEP